MGRELVNNDAELEKVVGGTIFFSEDHSTCGYFCDDQYRVHDFDAALSYIKKKKGKMGEKTMLKNLVDQGVLSEL